MKGYLGAKDYKQLDVIRKFLEGKQKFLTERDQEILSLCKVKVIDEEIKGSEVVMGLILVSSTL